MIRDLTAGALLLSAVFLYTRSGGEGLGSRIASSPPGLSVSSVTVDAEAAHLRVTVRNHLSHPARGEVDYVVLDRDGLVVYRSPTTSFPRLAPRADLTVAVPLRGEDLARQEVRVRVRERLAYVDEAQFDRSRVTPLDSREVER